MLNLFERIEPIERHEIMIGNVLGDRLCGDLSFGERARHIFLRTTSRDMFK